MAGSPKHENGPDPLDPLGRLQDEEKQRAALAEWEARVEDSQARPIGFRGIGFEVRVRVRVMLPGEAQHPLGTLAALTRSSPPQNHNWQDVACVHIVLT